MSGKAKRRKPKERFHIVDHPPSVRSESEKSKLLQILDNLARDSERRDG
jgi:hypothetical protein